MLQINIIEDPKRSDFNKIIAVNSLQDISSLYYENKDGFKSAYVYDAIVIQELLKYSPKEIGIFIDELNYIKEIEDRGLIAVIEILCGKDSNKSSSSPAKVIFEIDLVNWNKPYSITEFAEEISIIIDNERNPLYEFFKVDHSRIASGFGFTIAHIDENKTLFETDEILEKYINNLIDKTIASVVSKLDTNVLVTFFTFPEPIKTACKQYLIYFAQFLIDIGIEADTEIKEDAHKTLFKVIPKNNNDSLERIKNALAVYLNAPSINNQTLIHAESNNDVSVMQWKANILHLQSQVLLQNSIIQLKDATIEQLQLSNYQYQNSLKGNTQKNEVEKEEDIIEGILSLKKYDGKGFTINLAEILRRMKRTFKY